MEGHSTSGASAVNAPFQLRSAHQSLRSGAACPTRPTRLPVHAQVEMLLESYYLQLDYVWNRLKVGCFEGPGAWPDCVA